MHRRTPSRISEYLDTSRLDLSRTKMGTIMIYDNDNTYPIDDRGWVQKSDKSTSTGPTTRVKAYLKQDLPLLQTPRSAGAMPYHAEAGRPRVRIPNEFAHLQQSIVVDNARVQKPTAFNIDFNIVLQKLNDKTNDLEAEITAQLARVAREQTVGTFRKDGENDETDSIKSIGSTRSSRRSSKELGVENPEELDEKNDEHNDKSDHRSNDDDNDDDDDLNSGNSNRGEKNEEKETPKNSSRKSGNITNKQNRPANARLGWKPNPRHENMVLRLAQRRHASGGCCKRHLSRRPSKKNAFKLPDLTAGRQAFDRTSYQHSCPVTVYKNRMARVGY